jgi:hypothetical protein
MNMTLFIDYANADLRENPEDILMVLEAAKDFNQDHAGPQDPYQQNTNFLHHIVFSNVVNTCESLRSFIKSGSGYPYIYATNEISCCTGAYEKEFTPPGERYPVKSFPVDADARLIALEGSVFWAIHNDGCHGCNFNQVYERDKVCGADETEITCLECDQRFFIAALHQIIIDHSLGALVPFQEAAGRIIKTGHFPEGSSLKPCSWVEPCLMTFEPNRQQFSTFVAAVLWHDINRFLSQEKAKSTSPEPTDLIKQCRICGKFFIASRSNATNCSDCIGKEPPEALKERQQKYRYNKNIEYSRLYDRGIKFGLNPAEAESCLEYWINESGCKFSDILNLPDTTIFSFK